MRIVLGSSLIESLVALTVFSIGSASTATWMMHSMATHARASRLIAATTIAVSLEARMRVNRAGVLAGSYAQLLPSSVRLCDNGCDSMERASDDLGAFRQDLVRRMGKAAMGFVVCDVTAACVIHIVWSGRGVLVWPFHA